ncbi:cytochrome c, mono- and diheme variant [Flavobacteria bacterium BAL38]|uniref:cbb3-type cytochrome c oxidase N-terminal domain-containing protein n=1 Tax=unclassified Flavobacterium TaxID=196869 RepID=UPI0000F38A61|nr:MULTISPECIES: cbb3-type cytochrome c oxidase N-terminal domain-containing protein [unclassified Flavobacterium]EAZ94899.1 cytochrome c, mono- and diheme variant [Flavobacteria bacterium BAL38]MQP52817.1 c-type cytochrome [Flavobacterium sp. LMO9]MQP63091.1 c-type cytochrome [Flavobacterium sp. LMO6]
MKKLIPAYVRVPLLFAIVFAALEYFIDSGDRPAFIKFPMVALFLGVFLFLLIAIEIVIDAVDKVTYHLLTEEQKNQLANAQSVSFTQSQWYQNLVKKLTRSKEIEREEDIMLDHDYDGIKELDNVLPPWWVYLFYGTIIFALVYMVRFHVMNEYDQEQEFKNEVKLAELEKSKLPKNAADEVSYETVVALTDATNLAKGKEIFTNACAACHKADGGGLVGPNLTDDHWINGGGIKNIFKLISEGSKNNPSMVAWKSNLSSSDIQNIASYILTLKGTNPAGAKAAEGEIWKEEIVEATPEVVVSDSTKVEDPIKK